MTLASANQTITELQNLIKTRFTEFNRQSSPSRGRRYPPELRELVQRGHAAGIGPMELKRLSGMSETAIKCILVKVKSIAKSKPVASRRLEVVGLPFEPRQKMSPLTVRLPSGVTIEFADPSMLTATLLSALSSLEVRHATSC